MIVVYSTMFLLSFTGNSMTIYIVLSKPYMRSVTNCLIANMAIADLIMTFSAMPYSVAFTHIQYRWFGGIMGSITCKLLHFAVTLSIAASILSLVVIALDRFFAVVYPFKRPRVIRTISVMSTIIWVLSVLFASPYLYSYKAVLRNDNNFLCVPKWEPPVTNPARASRIYFIFVLISLYLIPMFIIAIFYSIVSFKLWVRRIPGNPTAANIRHAEVSKKRTIKMLVIVVIVFALCWLPAHVMHLLAHFEQNTYFKIPAIIPLIAYGISHLNSTVNPYLYIALNRNFRRAYVDVLQSCFKPAGSLVRSWGSNTTSHTYLGEGLSMEYVTVGDLGRSGKYDLSKTERDRDSSSIRQLSLMKLKENEWKQVTPSPYRAWGTICCW